MILAAGLLFSVALHRQTDYSGISNMWFSIRHGQNSRKKISSIHHRSGLNTSRRVALVCFL
jgi:hypothetical protein